MLLVLDGREATSSVRYSGKNEVYVGTDKLVLGMRAYGFHLIFEVKLMMG